MVTMLSVKLCTPSASIIIFTAEQKGRGHQEISASWRRACHYFHVMWNIFPHKLWKLKKHSLFRGKKKTADKYIFEVDAKTAVRCCDCCFWEATTCHVGFETTQPCQHSLSGHSPLPGSALTEVHGLRHSVNDEGLAQNGRHLCIIKCPKNKNCRFGSSSV